MHTRPQRRAVALVVATVIAAAAAVTARAQKLSSEATFILLAVIVIVLAAASTPYVMRAPGDSQNRDRHPKDPAPKPGSEDAKKRIARAAG